MITQIKEHDNVPGLDISTSYQKQNEWLKMLNRGKNTIVPTKVSFGPYILIPIGGVVEINGKMFQKLTTESLNLPIPVEEPLYVAVTDRGDETATFSLSNTQGLFNYAKWGYYMPSDPNTRILEDAVVSPSNIAKKWETEAIITGADVNSNGETTVQLTPGLKQIIIMSGAGGNPSSNGTNASGGVNGINGGDGKPLVNNTELPPGGVGGINISPSSGGNGGMPGMPCIRGFASSFNSFDRYQLEQEAPIPPNFTTDSSVNTGFKNRPPAIKCVGNNYSLINYSNSKGAVTEQGDYTISLNGGTSFNGLNINFPDNNLNYSSVITIERLKE